MANNSQMLTLILANKKFEDFDWDKDNLLKGKNISSFKFRHLLLPQPFQSKVV